MHFDGLQAFGQFSRERNAVLDEVDGFGGFGSFRGPRRANFSLKT